MSVQSTQGSRELRQAFGLTELFQPGAEVALSERLIEQAKRHARLLRRKDPSLNHADVLESVANTAGFSSWHNLQSTSKALAEGKVKATAAIGHGAYPLLATVTDGLEGEAAGALFTYAFVLAALVGLPRSTVSLALFFKGHYTSEPAEEEKDELTFHVLDTGEGTFWISEASHCRVERLMLLQDSLGSATPDEREQLAQEFVEIYEADEGVNCRLFLAERFAAHLPDEDKRVINMLGEGLKKCMDLIPEDFRGTIPLSISATRSFTEQSPF